MNNFEREHTQENAIPSHTARQPDGNVYSREDPLWSSGARKRSSDEDASLSSEGLWSGSEDSWSSSSVSEEIDLDQSSDTPRLSRGAKFERAFGRMLYSPRVRWLFVALVALLVVVLLTSQFHVLFPPRPAQNSSNPVTRQGYDGPVFTNVAVSHKIAYVETPTGKLVAHQTDSGKLLWSRQLSTLDYGQLIATDSAIYIIVDTNSQHRIDAYRASDGRLWWWQSMHDQSPFISLLVQDNILLANTWNGVVYVFDASTGKQLWQYTTNEHMALNSFASIDAGIVSLLMNDDQGTVHLLRARDGHEIMHYASMGSPGWEPFIEQGVVYSHLRDNSVQAYRLRDGAVLWHTAFAGSNFWSWSFWNNSIYVNNNGSLQALHSSDGKRFWQRTVQVNDTLWNNGQGKDIYLMTPHAGIIAMQASSGKQVWQKNAGALRYVPMLDSGIIYFGHNDRSLETWSSSSGTTLWSYSAIASILWYPQIVDGRMYVQQASGLLCVLDISNGHLLWQYQV